MGFWNTQQHEQWVCGSGSNLPLYLSGRYSAFHTQQCQGQRAAQSVFTDWESFADDGQRHVAKQQ